MKMNTFNEALQDKLSGKKGAYKIIRSALENLKQAGYPSEDLFLAISTVICRQNIDEIEEMWIWMRNQNITPYFEMITPQANAVINEWLYVDSSKLHDIFLRLSQIDREYYDNIWDPQPPLVGNRCMRHLFSCLVSSKGDVMPCVGVTLPIGNIREQKLSDILAESEVMKNLKNYRNTIKGPCNSCDKSEYCYGCRGAAYQLTGDYLASDLLCWKNADR